MNTRHRGKDKSTENVLKIESVKRDLISDSALLPDNFIALQSTMFSSRPSTNVCSMLLRAPGCQTLKISPPFYQQGRSGFFHLAGLSYLSLRAAGSSQQCFAFLQPTCWITLWAHWREMEKAIPFKELCPKWWHTTPLLMASVSHVKAFTYRQTHWCTENNILTVPLFYNNFSGTEVYLSHGATKASWVHMAEDCS